MFLVKFGIEHSQDYINILYLERSICRNCELYILKSWDQGYAQQYFKDVLARDFPAHLILNILYVPHSC